MSGKCDICGKGPMFGNNVSHSHKKTRKVFKPNLQKIKAEIDGKVKRVSICSRCLKSNKVKKVI
ncbi:MAG: 50S ribosomal protein L28 [Actinomycetota bacterium]|jgi:large subunit ribosomal protein L28|nr:50S ribosomal protein L28 [Actinomycetota bacterium]